VELKPALLAVVACVGTFGVAAALMNRSQPEPAGADASAPAVTEAPPAPAPTEPAPVKQAPAPAPAVERSSYSLPRHPVAAVWTVPEGTTDGRPDWLAVVPHAVAVNDNGTRVIVVASRVVDFWERGRAKPVTRLTPTSLSGRFVAPDASRVYLRCGQPEALETYDGTGTRLAVWPARTATDHPRYDRGGFPAASAQLTLGVGLRNANGFYTVAPETGQGRLAVRIENASEVFGCKSICPLPGGSEYLVSYEQNGRSPLTTGVYTVSAQGTFRKVSDALTASKRFGSIGSVTASADGRHIALMGGGDVKVWDRKGNACVLDWKKEYYFPVACLFGGGRVLIAASSNYDRVTTSLVGGYYNRAALPPLIQLYDLSPPRLVGEYQPEDLRLEVLALSPNGRFLAAASSKKVAILDIDATFNLTR
jgi:hypothetical protein